MRRASVVGPLILIGLGLILLVRNLYPQIPLFDFLGRYWPWVLIVWGVLRLGEVMAWKAQGKPLPSQGLSGGEWFLAILLTLFGAGIHTVRGFNFPQQFQISGLELFGERHEYPLEAEKTASAASRVILDDFVGDAKISGSSTAKSVKITGNAIVRAVDSITAERASHEHKFELTGDENTITFHGTQQPGLAARVSLSIDVTVPQGAKVEIRGRGGDLSVENVDGLVDVQSDRGDVHLVNLAAGARVQIRRNDVQLSSGKIAGNIDISSGDISAFRVAGPLKISGRSQDVNVNAITGDAEIDLNRGDIDLHLGVGSGSVTARTNSGDIRLQVPALNAFSVEAKTSRGNIENGLGGTLSTESSGRQRSLRGSVGSGKGPRFNIETNRGDISLQREGSRTAGEDKAPLEKLEQ